jgi:diaminopimelate epimerase
VKFTKMQGAGNDFVLVEAGHENPDWFHISAAVCDRHFGIGADGLLVFQSSDIADFKMRIFNADGSESGVCGNGLRCMIKYYIDRKLVGQIPEEIKVETMAGIRSARLNRTKEGINVIQTYMGKPGLGESDIPVLKGKSVVDINNLLACKINAGGTDLRLNLVSMGNPHAVYFTDKPVADYQLSITGPEIIASEIFQYGTNFEVVRVLNTRIIEARVWERGVGETLACGSGACAIMVAARLHGFTGNQVDIKLPGGTLKVEWDGIGEVLLSGPAEIVFTGDWTV